MAGPEMHCHCHYLTVVLGAGHFAHQHRDMLTLEMQGTKGTHPFSRALTLHTSSETQPMVRFRDCLLLSSLGWLEFPSGSGEKGRWRPLSRRSWRQPRKGPPQGCASAGRSLPPTCTCCPKPCSWSGPKLSVTRWRSPSSRRPGSPRAGLPRTSAQIWPSLRNTVRPAAESLASWSNRPAGSRVRRRKDTVRLGPGRCWSRKEAELRVPPKPKVAAGASAGREGARREARG